MSLKETKNSMAEARKIFQLTAAQTAGYAFGLAAGAAIGEKVGEWAVNWWPYHKHKFKRIPSKLNTAQHQLRFWIYLKRNKM